MLKKIQNRRVKTATQPIYSELKHYSDGLNEFQVLLENSANAEEVAEALSQLVEPVEFSQPVPSIRKATRHLLLATAYVKDLHSRLQIEDCERMVTPANVSALELHTQYLVACAKAMLKCVDPHVLKSSRITASQSIAMVTQRMAERANEFRVLSATRVERFSEKAYLERNSDLRRWRCQKCLV